MICEDENIGYKNPPKNTRFKKGQSGNPKGRPKKCPETLDDLIAQELKKPVSIREGNEYIETDKFSVVAKRIVDNAMKGDHKAISLVKDVTEKVQTEDKRIKSITIVGIPSENSQ